MSFIERLKIQKPNIPYLKEEGFTCVDMHVHSKYSDGLNKIKTIIKKAKTKGFGVAITDHNEIKGSAEAYKLAKDVLVIPGMEVNTSDGPDVLIYFYNIHEAIEYYNKFIKRKKGKDPYGRSQVSLKEIANNVNDYNCVVSAAHPCGPVWKNLQRFLHENKDKKKILKMFDAIEVMNGEMNRKMNVNAILWNLILNKSITGGSDGHTLGEIGTIVTYSQAETVEDFLSNIITENVNVMGTETKIRRKILSGSNNFRKHIKYIKPNLSMSFNYEYYKVLKPFMKKEMEKIMNGDFSRIHRDNRIAKKIRTSIKNGKQKRKTKKINNYFFFLVFLISFSRLSLSRSSLYLFLIVTSVTPATSATSR